MSIEVKFFPQYRHLSSDGRSSILLDVPTTRLLELDHISATIVEEALIWGSWSKPMVESARKLLIYRQFSNYDIDQAFELINTLRGAGLFRERDLFGSVEGSYQELNGLILSVSQTCQLKCAYCFAKGGNFGDEQLPSIMSSGVGRQAVDLLFNNCGQNNNRLYIAFFGGEPLINWALVKELTCYAEEKASSAGKNVSFSMTTNACLVDDEMVDFISSHKIDIMVSLDGEEHIHDKLRPHKSESTSSYEKTLAGVKALRAKINNISGNATITVINNDLEEVYSHLTEIGFTRIGMDMVSGSADKSLEFDHLHLSMHTQELVGLIVDGKVPLLANAPRLDERRSNRLYYCGFSRGSVTVDSIGRLYSCPRLVCVEKYQVGHVDAGYDSKKIQHLRSSIMIDNKLGCRTCWLRYLCGGGCPAESEESQGGIGSPYSQGCYRYQHLLEASVENYLISIRSNS